MERDIQSLCEKQIGLTRGSGWMRSQSIRAEDDLTGARLLGQRRGALRNFGAHR